MQFKIHIDKQKILDAVNEKMDRVAEDIFAKSQSNIVDKGIIDEGTLLKTGNIIREYLQKTIIYPVPYAESIEFGRLPGSMPPFEPIYEWVKRKLQVNDENEAKRIAWAIVQDIKVNGQEPRPFLGPAIESVKNKLRSN
jgi:hypothetical protein